MDLDIVLYDLQIAKKKNQKKIWQNFIFKSLISSQTKQGFN